MTSHITFRETIKYVFMSSELRKKLFFTIAILLFFRLGADITIPGITMSNSNSSGSSNDSLTGLLGMLGGGGLKQFSIFALGLSPYIMGTVIVQLLSADVIPSWSRLAKSGELGRKKLDMYGRYITLFIAVAQAYAITAALKSTGTISFSGSGFWANMYVILVLMGGSFLALWMGDMITKKGLGNGTSLIIFSGIVANLPWNFYTLFDSLFSNKAVIDVFTGILDAIFYLVLFAGLLIGTVFLNQSVRKIPVQGVGSGLSTNYEEISYLPLRVNSAGVIPVIFAAAILTTPLTVAQIINNAAATTWIQTIFSTQKPIGVILYFLLVFGFTYFYSHITVNSEDVAENFKKNGSFIPGISPGKDTERHIKKTLNRLNFLGGISLAVIATFPYFLSMLKGIPSQIAIGGTGIIIMVGVAIDTLTQVQGRIRQKSYAEFKKSNNLNDLKKSNKKYRKVVIDNDANTEVEPSLSNSPNKELW